MTDISSMTFQQFRARNAIGKTKFDEMNRNGTGPDVMDIDGMKRISIEAEARWRREREAAAKSPEAAVRHKRLLRKVTAASRAAVAAKKIKSAK